MTLQSQAIPVPSSALPQRLASSPISRTKTKPQSLLKAHMELGKVRLNSMVVFTTALGYIVGTQMNTSPDPLDPYSAGMHWARLFWTCLGTFLAAVGASAFNQAIEARRDARMHRTRNRPLCTGRLSRTYAATFGLIISIIGVAILCPLANWLTACLATGTVLIYAVIYTPLKPISTLNTIIGAVVGGIPPVLGYAAATDTITPGALVLGGILFIWQIPHFLALCWMYREDYARGGFKMLPIVDRTGILTSRIAFIYAILLMPLCLLIVVLGHAGTLFLITSFILTLAFVLVAMRFAITRTNPDARKLFFASIIYLPLLSTTLMFDARGPLTGYELTQNGYHKEDPSPFIDPESPEARQQLQTPTQTPQN